MISIPKDRLARLASVRLAIGSHPSFDQGACAMELVGWLAAEEWSDRPKCACPVIGAFMRAWNDALPEPERNQLLLPIVPRIVGTRGPERAAKRRALMAADWLVRANAPAWLRLAGMDAHARSLSSLPGITSLKQLSEVEVPILAARRDALALRATAWAEAWKAPRNAPRDALWEDTLKASWAGPRAAAMAAAQHSVLDLALDAARAAAGAASLDGRKRLEAVKAALQQTILALVDRIISAPRK